MGFASRVSALVIAAGMACLSGSARASDLSLPVAGNLIGSVLDESGTPRLGASIQVFDKFGVLVRKGVSTSGGHFAFAELPSDLYSVQVTLAQYLPAYRDGVSVRAGMDSLLQIHLTTLVSSIQLSYSVPTGAMSRDWKWVLRSSPSTRPITRFVPQDVALSSSGEEDYPRIFSGTHAVFSLSGGDSGVIDSDVPVAYIGTGFALSTNVFGKNQIDVGGSILPNAGFAPAGMSLCAIYHRTERDTLGASSPEVTVAVSQLALVNGPAAPASLSISGSGPSVRSLAIGIYQAINLGGAVRVEFGATSETLDYMQRTSRISPYFRVTAPMGKGGKVIGSYTDGGRPDALRAHDEGNALDAAASAADGVGTAVNTLSRLPQLSYGNGRLQLQRTLGFEVGYERVSKSRTYALSAFSERTANGRMDVAGDTSVLNSDDLTSDGVSATSVYNIGSYRRTGMLASFAQGLSSFAQVSLAYGRMGGFTSPNDGWSSTGSLASFLDQRPHSVANGAITTKAPRIGTRLSANYGWMDSNAIVPRHVFTTQNATLSAGLNFAVRQPLPSLFGMPGHLELSADLRNLLAQGYLPLEVGNGRTLLLVQSPRAIRGGLSFIF